MVEFAQGKPVSEIGNASYVKDGKVIHNPSRPLMQTEELDALPFATDVYQNNLTIENYNVPFLLHPVCFLLHGARLSGLMYVLPVAANAFGPCLAHTVGRKRCARIQAGAQDVPPGQGILL